MSHLLSATDFEKISEFIYRKSGIFFQEQKYYEILAYHIDYRCKKLYLDSFKKYFFKIRFDDIDGEEFQYLMNAITVNETYFFREKEQFEVLVNEILPQLHERVAENRALRILSSPCSNGSEPYSIVLHLLQEKDFLKKRDIEVVGIDIDSDMINKAHLAHYKESEIKAVPKDIVSKSFLKKKDSYQLDKDICASVKFHVVNILDRDKMLELGKFDVIFSRNMFMYFDDISREEVSTTFSYMLNSGGYLFLGNAEKMNRITSIFKEKKIGDVLVYKKNK